MDLEVPIAAAGSGHHHMTKYISGLLRGLVSCIRRRLMCSVCLPFLAVADEGRFGPLGVPLACTSTVHQSLAAAFSFASHQVRVWLSCPC